MTLAALLYAGSLWVGYHVTESVAVDSVAVTIAVTGQPPQRRVYAGCAKDSVAFVRPAGGTTVTASVTAVAYRRRMTAASRTASKTYSEPLGSGTPTGLAFGPYAGQDAGYPAPFTLSMDGYTAGTIVAHLDNAAAKGQHLVLNLTGGAHDQYLTSGVFDPAKWGVRMESYNTQTIRASIAAHVSDGTILGASVMDEPNVCGAGDGNTWGPCGTMTKVRVDSLCAAVQTMFPALNAGVAHDHAAFEPTKSYRVCQFVVDQWSDRDGTPAAFRDAGLALGARDHHAILFAMNVLNGGVQDRDSVYDCTSAGQAGLGTFSPNCRMTAANVKAAGYVLGAAGCGFVLWRYDAGFMAVTATALQAVSDSLKQLPTKRCVRF